MKYSLIIASLFLAFQKCNNDSKMFHQLTSEKDVLVYYPFSGNTKDKSLNRKRKNKGFVVGAKLTEDRNGQKKSAYYFDGEDDHIKIKQNEKFILEKSGAIMSWVKPEYTGRNVSILSNGTSNSPKENCYNLVLNRYSYKWEILAYIGGQQVNKRPNPILHDYNKWYFLVYQWEENGNVSLFVNGNLEFKDKLLSPPNPEINTELRIGQLSRSYFKGVIDELIICRRVFSEMEIKEIFAQTSEQMEN